MDIIDEGIENQNAELKPETRTEIITAGNWMKVYSITLIVFVAIVGIIGFGTFVLGSLSGAVFFGSNEESAIPLLLLCGMIVFLIRSISAIFRCSDYFSKLPESDIDLQLNEGFKQYKNFWVNNTVGVAMFMAMFLYALIRSNLF
jgi:hypothetical protein